jgi:hypothetical protein
MNVFLPSRYDELVTRLALGIEPAEPLHGGRLPFRVEVARDGVPLPPAVPQRDPAASPWAEQDVLPRVERRRASRWAVRLGAGVKDPLDLRLWDPSMRRVPRRLRVRLAPPPPLPDPSGRVIRPALWPGPAYDLPAGAMGCRGIVRRGGQPMRWTRVEARRLDDATRVVATAHGDERGEFLLILGPRAVSGAELTLPVVLSVTVFGPDTAPDPSTDPSSKVDPLWDLPLEEVPLAGADEVLAGTALPPGYRAGATRNVSFGADGLAGEVFVFT